MRLLVTGSNGFVAGSVIAQAGSQWEVHGIARSEIPSDSGIVTYHQCDLSDTEKFSFLFKQIKPTP